MIHKREQDNLDFGITEIANNQQLPSSNYLYKCKKICQHQYSKTNVKKKSIHDD